MAERVVPLRLAQIPNALTIARFAAIPVFIVLLATADGGHSWPAATSQPRPPPTRSTAGWHDAGTSSRASGPSQTRWQTA